MQMKKMWRFQFTPVFDHKKTNRAGIVFLITLFPVFLSTSLYAQGRPPANVVVSPVVRESIQDEILLIGTVESWRTSQVATEVSGRVEHLAARRGDKVKKGETLVTLADSSLLLQLKESRSKQNAAIARLEKAKDNLKRSEGLVKEGLVSERVYRDAKLTVEELKQTLAVNDAERLQIEDALNKKKVFSPFDGIVTQELTEEGQWVETGGSIVQLVDLSKVRILIQVPEKFIREVKTGGTVSVHIDAMPDQGFTGKVHAIIPSGDRESRLFPVEVHVENKELLLNEGMLARVAFGLGTPRPALMVEKDAVIRKGSEAFLFVAEAGKAMKKIVTPGRGKGGRIEVSGDLKEGDVVVIRGNERLQEGRDIKVVPLSSE